MSAAALEPDELSLGWLELHGFGETSLFWHDGALLLTHSERESEHRPTAEDWRLFWEVVDALDAWRWPPEHRGAALDGVEWSLRLARGAARLTSSGHNAQPPGFDTLVATVNRLVDGALTPGRTPAAPRALRQRAASYGALAGPPDRACAALLEEIALGALDDTRLAAAAEALGTLGTAALPALPTLLSALRTTRVPLVAPHPRLLGGLAALLASAANADDTTAARAEALRLLAEPVLQQELRGMLRRFVDAAR